MELVAWASRLDRFVKAEFMRRLFRALAWQTDHGFPATAHNNKITPEHPTPSCNFSRQGPNERRKNCQFRNHGSPDPGAAANDQF